MQVPTPVPAPVTLTRRVTLGRSLRLRRLALVLFCLIAALLASLTLIRIEPVNWVLGPVVALALTFALGLLLCGMDRSAHAGETLTLEPEGLRLDDAGSVRAVRWESLERLAKLPTPESQRATRGGGIGWVVMSVLKAADAPAQWGVCGSGRVLLKPNAPARVLQELALTARIFPAHPGYQPVAVYFADFEPDWLRGRIGDWVEFRRPDLIDAASVAAP